MKFGSLVRRLALQLLPLLLSPTFNNLGIFFDLPIIDKLGDWVRLLHKQVPVTLILILVLLVRKEFLLRFVEGVDCSFLTRIDQIFSIDSEEVLQLR